jgi:hypothetical protein
MPAVDQRNEFACHARVFLCQDPSQWQVFVEPRPFGSAIAGTILVSVVAIGTRSHTVVMIALAVFGLIGLVAALRLPSKLDRA